MGGGGGRHVTCQIKEMTMSHVSVTKKALCGAHDENAASVGLWMGGVPMSHVDFKKQ